VRKLTKGEVKGLEKRRTIVNGEERGKKIRTRSKWQKLGLNMGKNQGKKKVECFALVRPITFRKGQKNGSGHLLVKGRKKRETKKEKALRVTETKMMEGKGG